MHRVRREGVLPFPGATRRLRQERTFPLLGRNLKGLAYKCHETQATPVLLEASGTGSPVGVPHKQTGERSGEHPGVCGVVADATFQHLSVNT